MVLDLASLQTYRYHCFSKLLPNHAHKIVCNLSHHTKLAGCYCYLIYSVLTSQLNKWKWLARDIPGWRLKSIIRYPGVSLLSYAQLATMGCTPLAQPAWLCKNARKTSRNYIRRYTRVLQYCLSLASNDLANLALVAEKAQKNLCLHICITKRK